MSAVIGPRRDWMLLVVLLAGIFAMGANLLHVRRFAFFALVLIGGVTVALGLIVAAYRRGEAVTREPFDDAELPHQSHEVDEV